MRERVRERGLKDAKTLSILHQNVSKY